MRRRGDQAVAATACVRRVRLCAHYSAVAYPRPASVAHCSPLAPSRTLVRVRRACLGGRRVHLPRPSRTSHRVRRAHLTPSGIQRPSPRSQRSCGIRLCIASAADRLFLRRASCVVTAPDVPPMREPSRVGHGEAHEGWCGGWVSQRSNLGCRGSGLGRGKQTVLGGHARHVGIGSIVIKSARPGALQNARWRSACRRARWCGSWRCRAIACASGASPVRARTPAGSPHR